MVALPPQKMFDISTGSGVSAGKFTTNFNLLGDGGLVWIKSRSNATDHLLFSTSRGALMALYSNNGNASTSVTTSLTSFDNDGYTLGSSSTVNSTNRTYARWAFKKQARFFDLVSWTGNGVEGRAIAHNLGVKPGMIIIKCTDNSKDWVIYHRSLGYANNLGFTSNLPSSSTVHFTQEPTDTEFYIGNYASVNSTSAQYEAYVFAHDPLENGNIQCGIYTGNGLSSGGTTVNLGWKPQYVMVKRATGGSGDWVIFDDKRVNGTTNYRLSANTLNAEATSADFINLQANGFQLNSTDSSVNDASSTYVYMAIRAPYFAAIVEGDGNVDTRTKASLNIYIGYGAAPYTISVESGGLPPGLSINPTTHKIEGIPITPGTYSFVLRVDDAATEIAYTPEFTITVKKATVEDVYSDNLWTGTALSRKILTGVDIKNKGGLTLTKRADTTAGDGYAFDTVRGPYNALVVNSSGAQSVINGSLTEWAEDGFGIGNASGVNASGGSFWAMNIRKSHKFMTMVSWDGNGSSSRTLTHDLGIKPGLIIVKAYSGSSATIVWATYHRSLGATKALNFGSTAEEITSANYWNNTEPTATEFTVGSGPNASSTNYVAYLFAHDESVDSFIKCGTYTGNGSTEGPIIDLGWKPQFIMTKCSTSTYDWTAITENLGLESTGTQTLIQFGNTVINSVNPAALKTTSTGFQPCSSLNQTNRSGATYVYMAIRASDSFISGESNIVEDDDTLTGNYSLGRAASLSVTEGDDTIFARLIEFTAYSGSAFIVEGNDVASSEAEVTFYPINAEVSVTEDDDTLFSYDVLISRAVVNYSENDDIIQTIGKHNSNGSLIIIEGDDVAFGNGMIFTRANFSKSYTITGDERLLPLQIDKGDNERFEFQLVDKRGSVVNLNGYTAEMIFRWGWMRNPMTANVIAQRGQYLLVDSDNITIDPLTSTIRVNLGRFITNMWPASGVPEAYRNADYQLRLRASLGGTYTICAGPLAIFPNRFGSV